MTKNEVNKKKWTFSLGVILAIGIFSFVISGLLSQQKQQMARRPTHKQTLAVQTMTVRNNDVSVQLTLNGHLQALDKVELYAEVSGILKATPKRFKEGNSFNKGEVLINIDDSVYRNTLLAQKSTLLNQLTVLMADLSVDFPNSVSRWQHYLASFKMDKPLPTLPEPSDEKEKYYIAARDIYNLFFTIKSMENTLSKYTITAPYKGVVTESSINPGTLVRTGQKLGEFANTGIYELEAYAGIKDIPMLAVGNYVRLTCDELPGEFEGKVQRINSVIDKDSQTVKVYITSTDPRLKEGLYMNALIQGTPVENACLIPRTALVGKDNLYVSENNKMKKQKITIFATTTDSLIVRGLADGTVVLSNPPADAADGMELSNNNGSKESSSNR